jgi:hypothetical protein
MEKINETTKRFPRTLGEAFPHDVDQAYSISRYKPVYGDWAVWIMCSFAAGFLVGVLCMEAWK